jgi:type IV secretory pathway TraG/TraD family ATPase VirD4
MSLSISTANRPALLWVAGILLIVAWTYIAAGIFLIALDRDLTDATPLTLFEYWHYYGENQRVQDWLFISGIIASLICLAPMKLIFADAKKSLYGDARFASRKEIKEAGLLGEKGIVVGQLGNRYLMFGGQQHAIITAPTRKGKGVGLVIPNLLSWPESIVVLDIKQENWGITSAYRRKHGQECYLFSPGATDYRTHRYNPLGYISDDPYFRIDDAQQIANMLFPDRDGTDLIWTATPRTLFLGIVLYLLETPGKPVTLGQVLRETLTEGDGAAYFTRIISMRALAARIKETSEEDAARQAKEDLAMLPLEAKHALVHPSLAEIAMWHHMSKSYRNTLAAGNRERRKNSPNAADIIEALRNVPFDKEACRIAKRLSENCVRALNSYATIASENTRAGVMTAFRSTLSLWMNPLVDAATSANDFDLRDIRKRCMSIYLGVTPNNLERMAPLLKLFFQQLLDLNTQQLPNQNKGLKYTCLLLMDEFTALGRIPSLEKGISYLAGYAIRLMPIIQSPSQLVSAYDKEAAQTFTANHALNIVFAPKATEASVAKDISEWLGYQTVKGKSHSKATEWFSRKSKTESESDQRRALMLPQEIIGLGKFRELVVVEDLPPIMATKIRFYNEKVFIDRLKEVSPSLARLGVKLPTKEQMDDAIARGELGAPIVPLNLEAHLQAVRGNVDQDKAGLSQNKTEVHTTTMEREAIPQDMPDLSRLSLDRFVVDFSDVEIPKPGDLNEAVLHAYADKLSSRTIA